MALKPWRVLSSSLLFDGSPWLQLSADAVELHDGRVVDSFYQVVMRDFVIVYVTDGEGRTVMLRHYRHGPRRVVLSLPGGLMEAGEDPLETGRRELLEETGHEASAWRLLGRYTMNSNYGCGTCHAYLASAARRVAKPDSGDLEEAVVELVDRPSLLAALGRGEVAMMSHAGIIAMALATESGFPAPPAQKWSAKGAGPV
jgi:ADP-ribose pyrophosphatase